MATTYDVIGECYSSQRRTDPRIAGPLWKAFGDAQTVLNVGAGAGSYEPPDRHVIAVDPSEVSWRSVQAEWFDVFARVPNPFRSALVPSMP